MMPSTLHVTLLFTAAICGGRNVSSFSFLASSPNRFHYSICAFDSSANVKAARSLPCSPRTAQTETWWGRGGAHSFPCIVRSVASALPNEITKDSKEKTSQKNNNKRNKRRRNTQVFKHLFRHHEDISIDCWLRCAEPREFLLSCGYTEDDIERMVQKYPQLLKMDVHTQLAPKVRFIVKTLGGGKGDLVWAVEDALYLDEEEECDISDIDSPHRLRVSDLAKVSIPPEFFGLRLERHIGPRHAYLQHFGLLSGPELLAANGRRMKQFLDTCTKSPREFAMLAMRWVADEQRPIGGRGGGSTTHTAERVETFEEAFRHGLLGAARGECSELHRLLGSSPGRMAELLIDHGANYLEPDRHGASLLHWAAGTGNLKGMSAILEAQSLAYNGMESPRAEVVINTQNSKDGATALHWASCGVDSSGFGTGGHDTVCRHLLDTAEERSKGLANAKTMTDNTPIMWAAWAGSLDVVKLLVSYGADPHFRNDNGCNSAHWAASGGNVDVCKYLYEELGVDFIEANKVGHTPLNHAINYGQGDIVEWILHTFYSDPDKAAKLLQDEKLLAEKYVKCWEPGDGIRRVVLQQLQDATHVYDDGSFVAASPAPQCKCSSGP